MLLVRGEQKLSSYFFRTFILNPLFLWASCTSNSQCDTGFIVKM
eukprot:UN16712